MQPPNDAWPDVTGHTLNLFVGRLEPALVSRFDGMTAGAELRVIGERNRHSPHSHCAGHDRSDHNGGGSTHRPVRVWGNAE